MQSTTGTIIGLDYHAGSSDTGAIKTITPRSIQDADDDSSQGLYIRGHKNVLSYSRNHNLTPARGTGG